LTAYFEEYHISLAGLNMIYLRVTSG